MNVTDEAVEAAHKAWREQAALDGSIFEYNLRAAIEAVAPFIAAEAEKLRAHILDIDAHATPFGDIPEDPGYVGSYLVSAGSLHRALGTIGHAAPSCEAEVERVQGRTAWHDAVSEAYVEGALSAEQANVMWAKNPYKK